MKKLILLLVIIIVHVQSFAQCSMCTKTASQLGEKPAQGLNSGILYLMMMPFVIVGFIAWRWWRANKAQEVQEAKA
jgi:hypothetical protein